LWRESLRHAVARGLADANARSDNAQQNAEAQARSETNDPGSDPEPISDINGSPWRPREMDATELDEIDRDALERSVEHESGRRQIDTSLAVSSRS
jgi:hypothetical protein